MSATQAPLATKSNLNSTVAESKYGASSSADLGDEVMKQETSEQLFILLPK